MLAIVVIVILCIVVVAAVIVVVTPGLTFVAETNGVVGLERLGPIAGIRLSKINAQAGATETQNETFQVGELVVTNKNGRRLTRQDFKEITFNGQLRDHYAQHFSPWNMVDGDLATFSHTDGALALHQYNIILNHPTLLRNIIVENRYDCCQGRLDGVVLELYNEKNEVVYRQVLTAAQKQDIR